MYNSENTKLWLCWHLRDKLKKEDHIIKQMTSKSVWKNDTVDERILPCALFTLFVTFWVPPGPFHPFLMRCVMFSSRTHQICSSSCTLALVTCPSSQMGAVPEMAHTPAAATIASHPNVFNFLSLPWDEDWAKTRAPLCQQHGSYSKSGVRQNLAELHADSSFSRQWLSQRAE